MECALHPKFISHVNVLNFSKVLSFKGLFFREVVEIWTTSNHCRHILLHSYLSLGSTTLKKTNN